MRGIAAATRFFAACLVASLAFTAAWAGEASQQPYQVAWLQPHTIFHSGLIGSHTLALTFDDGPNRNTLAVLKALKKHNIKATFFIVGRMAEHHPEILREIARQGHLLANHSATHPFLSARYDRHPAKLIAQLMVVNRQIAPLQPKGTEMFFRAPYGVWRAAHARILNANPVLKNYIGPIYWDIGGETRMNAQGYVMSSADWNCWQRHWDAQVCAKGYLREIRRRNGGVVLMHCIDDKSGALVAAILPPLIQEGYRFVRLDQVPAYDKYRTPTKPQAPMVAMADAEGRAATGEPAVLP